MSRSVELEKDLTRVSDILDRNSNCLEEWPMLQMRKKRCGWYSVQYPHLVIFSVYHTKYLLIH
ncbi:hypothetical protein NSIN_10031 [Nitrosotalea sinensis]|uniref:Uncharacterized protein n=1 Tax=Nitrosotalea sinensis TaxID=1499975 RepID=A0A2H1EDU4_9ARCH|nr:hypothetical protein NSIN_10031 [Candidatus Nitrosotalea sinensis]